MALRLNDSYTNPCKYKIHHDLIMKYLLQYLIKWLLAFMPRILLRKIKDTNIPKQKIVDFQDIFTCTSCTEPLYTIYRFKDQSFCMECREEIDSSSSDSDSD